MREAQLAFISELITDYQDEITVLDNDILISEHPQIIDRKNRQKEICDRRIEQLESLKRYIEKNINHGKQIHH